MNYDPADLSLARESTSQETPERFSAQWNILYTIFFAFLHNTLMIMHTFCNTDNDIPAQYNVP